MGPLAIGTDAAGSLRVPAAFCGAVGFKPSFGRVPAYPPSPFGSLSHVGPITMSVLDMAMVMNVVKQPDVRDWSALPPDGRDYLVGLNDGVRGLRIAWSPTLGYAHSVHADVAAASLRAAEAFVEMGAHVEQVDPGIADPLELAAALLQLGAWHTWNALTPAQRAQTDPDFAAQAQLGARLSALDVQDLQLQRAALGTQMRQFMAGYDLLLTPAVAEPAFDALPAGHRPVDAQSMLGWTPFSYPFNLTQQPACSIPCGLSGAGLPIGLQIVGPMFGDALVLRAARAYESHRPLARPPLAALI
jgi:aspartyl-tRNA(Asn)/glutamyl-tRNA(Gln) amidotransferase subunit A